MTLVKRYLHDRWNPGQGRSHGVLSEGPPWSDFSHPVANRTVDAPVINPSFPSAKMIDLILRPSFFNTPR